MMLPRISFRSFLLTPVLLASLVAAQEQGQPSEKSGVAVSATTSATETAAKSGTPSAPAAPKYATHLKEATPFSGLLNVYQKGNKLYGEISDYSSEYIVLISIAKGIGQRPLLGGYSWGFGDDWVWKFRKIDDRVHIIRKNVRFKAKSKYPEDYALQNAYTDSVLFSLPIITKGPKGGDLVDLSSVFMSDLPKISQYLPGFVFSSTKSSWAFIKPFPTNMELEVAATYSSSGRFDFDTVADSRGITVNVHYSISKVPTSGYRPRLADDRIGYFLTVRKDYTKKNGPDQFVRYINRWKLDRPPGADAGPTPPKQPIVFWIEKTVPHRLRRPIREGIAEWNKAFEKAGWINAIEVRQQPDDATWDPEDVNYNTFRWMTSDAGFAMGPSRVNPYTGEILDADIIFDADFLQYWKREFETLDQTAIALMTGGAVDVDATTGKVVPRNESLDACYLSTGMSRQLALGATAIMGRVATDPKKSAVMEEKMIMQGLKEVAMHEVGHTLGLRHNFKASQMLSLKDVNDPEKTKETGMVASVMDYAPTNIMPKGSHQGDYYTHTIGPYDYWAIEYGYKYISGDENKTLAEIAARSGEPELQYATDEDTGGLEPDPDTNRFDLGNDALEYAKSRAQLVQELLPTLVDRMSKEGEDYTKVRQSLNVLLAEHGAAMFYAARNVGGLQVSRSHKGDKDARPPVSPLNVKKQRETLELLEQQVFSDAPYDIPKEMFQYLATTNWNHWGQSIFASRKAYPVHDQILMWQQRVLDQVMSSVTLERIHDIEFKTSPDADVLTSAELIERLTKAIFSEVDSIQEGEFTNRRPAISSLRRNLQRDMLGRLSRLAMGRGVAPEDCKTIAFAELSSLESRIDQVLKSKAQLDSYSRAHLQEAKSRIGKVLEAKLALTGP